MEQTEETAGWGGAERMRVTAVVETLATLRSQGESLAEVAHDARNMVTALGLYCDLLEEPGVLATPFLHYGSELRLVAAASRRLVEKLVAMDARPTPQNPTRASAERGAADHAEIFAASERRGLRLEPAPGGRLVDRGVERTRRWDPMPAESIPNLAGELLANRNLLAALAGPSIALSVVAEGGSKPVRMTGEDLTRVLVNLVKNAAEAMPGGGSIRLGLREQPAVVGGAEWVCLSLEDSGPGIPREALEKIFDSGYTTHLNLTPQPGVWLAAHRGLGLAITRSIIEEAGGRIHASNRAAGTGARFEIELPVESR